MRIIDAFSGKYAFLSNFYPTKTVKWNGEVVRTLEHAFQAAKTFNQHECRDILDARTPGEAKRLGRRATKRDDWEDVRNEIMLALLRQKFTDEDLRDALLWTENWILVEGNTWGDTYWGKCNGRGENHLGLLLMQVRSELGYRATC